MFHNLIFMPKEAINKWTSPSENMPSGHVRTAKAPRVGRGVGELPIYGIVWMCVPNGLLFQRCQVNDWPPFFNKMYMNDPIFLDSYVKRPIFLTSCYMHIFFARRFFEAACSLGIRWIDCDICLTTINKWLQKIKGQYMNRSTFWMIVYEWVCFFKGQVYEWGRFWNTWLAHPYHNYP